jgi:hypothetical protein
MEKIIPIISQMNIIDWPAVAKRHQKEPVAILEFARATRRNIFKQTDGRGIDHLWRLR